MMGSLLAVDKLSVRYGPVLALSDVNLTTSAGEIVTLLGSNGAGKSTLMRALIGLAIPSGGSISFNDEKIENMPVESRVALGIATVLEGRGMLPRMTVLENLQMGAYLRANDSLDEDFGKVFSTFPVLKERLKQLAGTLSGGEQQMLAFGRAMMLRPKLILMDEPSMGLAPVIVEKVFEAIESINRAGTSVLLIEQNARMALSIAHRFYVLSVGSIVLAGKVSGEKLLVERTDGRVDEISEEELEAAYLEGS
ncbi:MAG: ABC transporter ATP-binding protein [Afipia sp.]|nr:ABC transporter ATP-binding protein [Afipia sp.]